MFGLLGRGWGARVGREIGPLAVLVTAAALTAGCSGDLSFGDGEGGNGDDGGTAGLDSDGSGADTGGPGDGGGSSGDDGAASPDCGDYFCDGVGTCIEAEGELYCECDEGLVLEGNTCIECEPIASDAFDVDVAVVRYAGDLRIDGTTTKTSIYDRGRLVAVNVRTLDEVEITTTRNGSFDVGIVPGVYDLYYELEQGGINVPRNEHAHLGTVALVESRTREIIDLRPRRVRGEIAVNGVKLNTSINDRGTISFENTETGDVVHVGTTEDGTYDALVLPGTYDVYYGLITGGIAVPGNSHGLVATGVVVPEAPDDPNMTADVDLDVDMQMVAISGGITVGGSTPTTSNYDDGNLWLVADDGTDRLYVGNTHDGAYSANALEGSYTVEYGLESGGITVPRNRAARLGTFEVDGGATGDINIPATTVSGTITLDGATPSTSAYDDGQIWLATPEGDEAALGLTSDGSFSALVVPGTYELRYGVESAGATVPINSNAMLDSVDVDNSPQFDVNIPTVAIDGGITVAGVVPSSSVYESARIMLRGPGGDVFELGRTHESTYSGVIIPGTYDVTYVEDGAPSLPGNRNGRVMQGVELKSSMSLPIDVPVVTLSGSVQVNGGPPPSTADDSGRIYLERRSERDTVFVTSTDAPSFDTEVIPGQYDVYYRVEQSAGTVPNNERARLTCVQVQ